MLRALLAKFHEGRPPPDAPAAVRGVRIASCEGLVVSCKKKVINSES